MPLTPFPLIPVSEEEQKEHLDKCRQQVERREFWERLLITLAIIALGALMFVIDTCGK